MLTILKAALNHARAEGRVSCPADAWASVQAFREADKAKVRYLQDDEICRLVNVCPADFRALVSAALPTGCRYGELAAMKAGDFDPQAGTVTHGSSKSGRPRHIVLTDEGRQFFAQMSVLKIGQSVCSLTPCGRRPRRLSRMSLSLATWVASPHRVIRDAMLVDRFCRAAISGSSWQRRLPAWLANCRVPLGRPVTTMRI